jgi:hypothetical protein
LHAKHLRLKPPTKKGSEGSRTKGDTKDPNATRGVIEQGDNTGRFEDMGVIGQGREEIRKENP